MESDKPTDWPADLEYRPCLTEAHDLIPQLIGPLRDVGPIDTPGEDGGVVAGIYTQTWNDLTFLAGGRFKICWCPSGCQIIANFDQPYILADSLNIDVIRGPRGCCG